jgi:biofilm PGA synthesis N-glycosyltransferase PgaC
VSSGLTYAAVTPARDEAANLPRLAQAMVAQTRTPERWVIVENGSSDETRDIARRLADRHPWITLVVSPPSERYDRTSPYMRAFHRGVEELAGAGGVVVKLDADVSFEPDFFAGLLAAFAERPELGIVSGTLLEEHGGGWRESILLGDHCWGPTRAYRRACLEAVLPLDDSTGYASIDETKAHLAGFATGVLRQLPFKHHRPEGSGEGSRFRSWKGDGAAAHYTGYRFSYLLVRALYRMRRDPTAAGLLAGYLGAAARRRPRYADKAVIRALRDEQRVRRFFPVLGSRFRRA